MGFLSFSAALLNFGPSDRLWHLHTPEAVQQRVRNGVIMHASPGDDIRLIEVPFARLAQPILSRLLSSDPTDTQTIMNKHYERESIERHQHCQEVIERLTPTQCNVLRAIALGAHPQQVAHMLERSIDTIGSHINVVLRECRNAWDMPEKARLDYHFLQAAFADYFVHDEKSVHH